MSVQVLDMALDVTHRMFLGLAVWQFLSVGDFVLGDLGNTTQRLSGTCIRLDQKYRPSRSD